MIEFALLVVIGLVGYFAWNRYRMMTLRDRLGIAGPKAHFLFGNVPDLVDSFKKCEQVHPLFQKWRKQYGPIYGVYFGPKLYIIVNDLEIIREVLVKQFSSFENRPGILFMAHKPLSEMLVNLKGERWRQLRQQLSPTFTTSKLKQMSEPVNKVTDVFLDTMAKHASLGETFDIYNPLQRVTLDIIGKCAFATDVQSQTNTEDPFLKTVQTFITELSTANSLWLRLCFLFPEFNEYISYFRPISKTGIAESWMFNAIRKVISARKEILHQFKSVDVLQVLLEQNETTGNESNRLWKREYDLISLKMTDSEIEANVFVFAVAGYETTSTAVSYTLWLLAKHQHEQRKLQKEIDEKIRLNEPLNYETLHKMPYLDSVFKESLRLYPPVTGFLSRRCNKDCTIRGVNFVKGVDVMILPRLIHEDPDIWHEPDNFEPERFINASKEGQNAMNWLPFGAGPRNCIGMRFADLEAKILLFRLFSKYNVELGPNSDPLQVQEIDFVQRPKAGVFVKLSKR